ncbi:F-box only protein 4 [Aplysia californica]|uniref:F-box only protein 4 n=1 Tax=Aplysia californica TaxID=6500 RepID=A0ABM0JEW6_APLCA|nr:F-box only protein 4 [Aplysia californica]
MCAMLVESPLAAVTPLSNVKCGKRETQSRSCENDKEDLPLFLASIQNLLVKYKMYSKSQNVPVASGGLQQFVTQKLKKQSEGSNFSLMKSLRALYGRSESVTLPVDENENGEIAFFQYLPVDLKLYIFSFLDAKALCMACCVCQEWSQLTCDELLWQHRLQCDLKMWPLISHVTNPQMYSDVECEWSTKEIYLRCSPDFHKQLHQANSTFHHVSSVLKYLMPKKVPKAAMFGPGLEQSTSGLVRKMLYEDNQIFTRVAMFPGQFDGVGGGMTLRLGSGHSVHLSVLYSASKQERENHAAEDRLRRNKMLLRLPDGAEGDGESEPQYELTPQIKHLCQTLDAFIFVIDSSESKEAITNGRLELNAMIRERKSAPHIPLLVLSCVKDASKPRLPACEIIDLLRLSSISQPWLVIDCITDTLASVDEGIIWLVDQARYK